MQKQNHIILQTLLTCLQYLIPAFIFTHLTKEQESAIALSMAAIQGALAISNHVTPEKRETNANVIS